MTHDEMITILHSALKNLVMDVLLNSPPSYMASDTFTEARQALKFAASGLNVEKIIKTKRVKTNKLQTEGGKA